MARNADVDTQMAPETENAATTDSDPPIANASDTIEVPKPESVIKDDDVGDDRSGDEGDAPEEDAAGDRPVSNDQYRAFKSIADTLTNYSYKNKGGE